MKKRISLGILAMTIIVLGLVGAVVYYQLGFKQKADVLPEAIITVYTLEDQSDELTQGEYLDWGTLSSGTYTMELWVKNTGTVNALIALQNHGGFPGGPGGWTETWDYNNVPIVPDAVVKVTITLTLPADIGSGHYEWDSGIMAWKAP